MVFLCFLIQSQPVTSPQPPPPLPPNVPIRTITLNLPLWRQQKSIMGPPAWVEGAAMLSSSVGLQIDGVCLRLRLFAQRGAEGGSTQMVHTFCELPPIAAPRWRQPQGKEIKRDTIAGEKSMLGHQTGFLGSGLNGQRPTAT